MAKRRRRRRRRNQLVPILVAMFLIVLVAIAGIVTGFIKKYTPSDARMDLADYYHTNEDEAALILQDTISEAKGKIVDGEAYLPYSVITKELGGRFYWDKESQRMLYTTTTDTLEIKPEDTAYTIAGQSKQQDYVIVKEIGEEFYIALDFGEKYIMSLTGLCCPINGKKSILYLFQKTRRSDIREVLKAQFFLK